MSSRRETHQFRHPLFGLSGPSLCAVRAQQKHWLPKGLVHVLADSRPATLNITLTSLSWYTTVGRHQRPSDESLTLMVDIGNRYTVELRTREGWDAGMPVEQSIIINQLRYYGSACEPILMKSAGGLFVGPVSHEWSQDQQWDSRQAGNSNFPEPDPALVGYTLITVLGYELEQHRASVRIQHYPHRDFSVHLIPEELYQYEGCLLILDGQLIRFPAKHPITTVTQKMVAIEQASHLADKSSAQFQIDQLQQISQQALSRIGDLQQQLKTDKFKP